MKALFIVVPILLIGGALGAGFMGVINIPGVTPRKAPIVKKETTEQPTADDESTATDAVEDQQVTADPPTTGQSGSATPRTDDPNMDAEQGAKALAKYWDEIDVAKLIPITETYREHELAQVLFFMQKAKVAELLSTVDAERAARLSRELQGLASVVKPEAP